MTLNEAIEYYDSLAEECRRKASIERNDYMDLRDESAEYSQLSEWLAELAVLREKVNCSELPNSSGDLISRQAVLDLYSDLYWGDERLLAFRKELDAVFYKIRALPTVQAEQKITHCENCKHKHLEKDVLTCPFGLPGGPKFFCGYGSDTNE